MLRRAYSILPFALVTALLLPQGALALTCQEYFRSYLSNSLALKQKRYPKGIDPLKNPDWNIKYGFESEYVMDEIGKLTSVYGPDPSLGLPASQWFAMSEAGRVDWVKKNIKKLYPEDRSKGLLVKLQNDPKYRLLPDSLVRDDHNIELVLSPMDTLSDWDEAVNLINREFGVGSMQGTSGTPWEAFFHGPGGNKAAAVAANEGYLSFMSDLDTLGKLEAGYNRDLVDPDALVTQSFTHHYLGPMTAKKREKLSALLRDNAEGKALDKKSLAFVSGRVDSPKYFGGSAYRPDLDPGKNVILEARDCHRNLDCLRERMLRNSYYLETGRDQFAPFQKLASLDTEKDYLKLPADSRAMLEKIFPMKAVDTAEYKYTDEERFAVQVYRNFAYPLRDWSRHLELTGRQDLAPVVKKAQEDFVADLEGLSAAFKSGQLPEDQARIETQYLVSRFAHETKIREIMENWQEKHLMGTREWNHYTGLAARDFKPFAKAFPDSIWTGTLESRVENLRQKWPKHIQMVDDVEFSYSGVKPTSKKRKVLVISRQGLSPQEEEALRKDYLNAISQGTVSFPLGNKKDHLFSRIGHQTVDFDFRITQWSPKQVRTNYFGVGDYRLSRDAKLETVVALDPLEEMRLRSYVENVEKNSQGTLGTFSFDGTTSQKTTAKRKENLPLTAGEGQNCTSWVCTAPIGYKREKFIDLVGGNPPGDEVHTSPGWLTHYLTGAAKDERIPFVVYWTDKPLDTTVKNEVVSGQKFPSTYEFQLDPKDEYAQ